MRLDLDQGQRELAREATLFPKKNTLPRRSRLRVLLDATPGDLRRCTSGPFGCAGLDVGWIGREEGTQP
jgi:hypothetical protein